MIKRIIVSLNIHKDPDLSFSHRVVDILLKQGATVYLPEQFSEQFTENVTFFDQESLPRDAELILVLGGDGSVLQAAQDALTMDIPILGVNLGRLGFLNDLEKDRLEMLSRLQTDDYSEKERMVLDVSIRQNGKESHLAVSPLNDVVVSGNGHLVDMHLEQCGMCAIDYRADGMVIATPSGSTAYTLSAGGPVIDDRMEAICVTPICPRSFFGRSVLFCAEDVLRLENTSSLPLSVILDGHECGFIAYGDSITIKRSKKRLRMLVFEPHSTLEVLQQKMNMQNF